MKKLLLFLSCVFTALVIFAQGKVYTEQLVVTINGESSEPQEAGVVVFDNGDGTINFVLKNFFLSAGEDSMPVGNINVENLPVAKGADGLDSIFYEGIISIQPGDMEGISESDWFGPQIGEIPMKLVGKMNEEKLYVTIDINLQETLGQIVYVQLGTDDFSENFAQSKVYTEQLIVTINGESSEPQEAGVVVFDNGDGTINFVLKNFFLSAGEDSMPVGNINVENLPVAKGADGLDNIFYEGIITIQPGDMEGISESDWFGPQIGEIPMKLVGKMNEEKLYVTIDINLQETLGQIVYVQLGTDDFNDDNQEDAIGHVIAVSKTSSAMFDLSGRRVEKVVHGIYVVDGKKVRF